MPFRIKELPQIVFLSKSHFLAEIMNSKCQMIQNWTFLPLILASQNWQHCMRTNHKGVSVDTAFFFLAYSAA